jgi:hypothetical protein
MSYEISIVRLKGPDDASGELAYFRMVGSRSGAWLLSLSRCRETEVHESRFTSLSSDPYDNCHR